MDKNGGIFQRLFKEVQMMDYRTPMDRVLPAVGRDSAVIITKQGDYYGIIDTKVLQRSGSSTSLKGTKAEAFAVNVPKITPNTNMDDAVYYFCKSRTKALPYAMKGKVKGVLERTTLLKALLSLGSLNEIRVSEAMTSPIMAIDIDSNIAQARSVMRDNGVNRLAVIQNGKFIGLVTNRDIISGYSTRRERLPEMKTNKFALTNIPIAEVTRKNVITLDQNRSASDAAREFINNNISSIVVTSAGKPVGMVTVTDVLESLMARKRIEPNRMFISGLHSLDYDYESEVRGALSEFLSDIERLERGRMDVDYITLNIKKQKTKSYELMARLSLGRRGIISIRSEGYLFEDTLRELLSKLKREVIKNKDINITVKRSELRGE
jgi:predicted transcriptional regulator